MQLQNKRLIIFILMIITGIFIIFLLSTFIDDERLKNLLLDYRSWDEPLGVFTVQNIMWIVFFIGLGEIIFRVLKIIEIQKGMKKGYLPEDDQSILESADMNVMLKGVSQDSKIEGSLANMIKKLVLQFQTSNSIEQTQNMLNAQLEMQSNKIDTNYNMIRYITWFIPTLGFIGTVIGISKALEYAGEVNGQGDRFVAQLTEKLAVAFDTTFLALIMSAVLVFLMHIIQGREEKNLVQIGQYSLDNFINRLYVEKESTINNSF